MKYLLDINVLIAAGHTGHKEHARAMRWLASVKGEELLTSSITELGFVRISAATGLQPSVAAARSAIARWNKAAKARLVADTLGAAHLPDWADAPARTTDGHLMALASCHGATLATMDSGTPGALLLP